MPAQNIRNDRRNRIVRREIRRVLVSIFGFARIFSFYPDEPTFEKRFILIVKENATSELYNINAQTDTLGHWNGHFSITWVVAEVGNTRIWVQVTSCGVDKLQLTDAWLKRSSGVNWSGIIRNVESASSDTKHALSMHGMSPDDSKLHCPQISFSCLEALFNELRLNSQLHPETLPNRPIMYDIRYSTGLNV